VPDHAQSHTSTVKAIENVAEEEFKVQEHHDQTVHLICDPEVRKGHLTDRGHEDPALKIEPGECLNECKEIISTLKARLSGLLLWGGRDFCPPIKPLEI